LLSACLQLGSGWVFGYKSGRFFGDFVMQAETLNCPMCGAPQATDATRCEHCGARLATVACPSCFGLIFQGAKFCSHCGAKVERTETASETQRMCPRCKTVLDAITVGGFNLLECGKCEGLWVDKGTFAEICQDNEKQTALLGISTTVPKNEINDYLNFHYIPCPVCKELMNRVQFANCSHIIIDVCQQHGVWFDKDELRKVVEFIRAGGMDKCREREIEQLEQKRSLLNADRAAVATTFPVMPSIPTKYDAYDMAFEAIGAVLRGLFKL
jgi:Zn-finger nucleic acid-binding protein